MTPKLMQLYAIRAQIEALIAMEETQITQPSEPSGCDHPEEKRVQSNNIGQSPEFFCQACKQFVKGVA